MNLIKPRNLKIGDTIGIVATSGNLKSKDSLNKAISYFETRGFKVVLAENLYDKKRYLAGEDEVKIEQLHKMFADKNVKAIFCLRGGYGAIRLINKIGYELIKNNPKIFIGYSDITALSAMFLKRADLITYSGPMCLGDFGSDEGEIETFENCFEVLMTDNILEYKPFEKGLCNEKTAKGITFGGNLSTLVSLCGIDFIPDEDFIFFIEDLNEPVYKIDKMLTQLSNIPKFRKNIKGLILGEFLDIENYDELNEVFKEFISELNIAVLGNFRITHNKKKITIPYGAKSEIKNGKFIIYNN